MIDADDNDMMGYDEISCNIEAIWCNMAILIVVENWCIAISCLGMDLCQLYSSNSWDLLQFSVLWRDLKKKSSTHMAFMGYFYSFIFMRVLCFFSKLDLYLARHTVDSPGFPTLLGCCLQHIISARQWRQSWTFAAAVVCKALWPCGTMPATPASWWGSTEHRFPNVDTFHHLGFRLIERWFTQNNGDLIFWFTRTESYWNWMELETCWNK